MPVRVPLNLATEPFRRDRPVIVAAAGISVALLITLFILIPLIYSERGQSGETRALLDRLHEQIRAVDREQATLDATLRRPENAEVLERSLFLNGLIARKSISWTRLFADLERVMPHEVRLQLVRLPQVDSQNQVWLEMTVAAKEAPPVLDFIRRLEQTPQFQGASVLSSQPASQTEPYVRYRVSVSYAQKL